MQGNIGVAKPHSCRLVSMSGMFRTAISISEAASVLLQLGVLHSHMLVSLQLALCTSKSKESTPPPPLRACSWRMLDAQNSFSRTNHTRPKGTPVLHEKRQLRAPASHVCNKASQRKWGGCSKLLRHALWPACARGDTKTKMKKSAAACLLCCALSECSGGVRSSTTMKAPPRPLLLPVGTQQQPLPVTAASAQVPHSRRLPELVAAIILGWLRRDAATARGRRTVAGQVALGHKLVGWLPQAVAEAAVWERNECNLRCF